MYKKYIFGFIFLGILVFAQQSLAQSILDTLVGTGKKCNYVDQGLYMPFSDINDQFPVFGAMVRGECVDVKNPVTDMFLYGFKVFLGLVSIIAVINISVAGIQYMIQEKDTSKLRGAKKRLTQSIVGLILAISGFLILNGVNTKLTDIGIDFSKGSLFDRIQQGARMVENIAPVAGAGDCITGSAGCVKNGGGTNGGSTDNTPAGNGQFDDEYLKQKIAQSGISELNPSDLDEFFPDGQSTPENWLKLAKGIAKYESGFKAKTLYAESFGNRPPAGTPGRIPESEYPNSNSGRLSIGLFALSWDDPEVKAKGYTERDLQDPNKNLEVGIEVMKRVVQKNGCIACASRSNTYWSVLQTKQSEIKDYIRSN